MQKLKTFSLIALCFIIGLCSSLLYACGGGNENRIRINEVTHSIFYAPFYAALNMGYFEDEGLEVVLESNDGSHTSMSILLSGNCEMALIGPEQVVYATATKDTPVVFGQLTKRDGSFIVSKDPIENFSLDMLKGKTIIGGRAGGLPAMTLQYVIETNDLVIGENDPEKVNLRTDVQFANIATEFQTTNNEFCTLFEPTATNLVKENKGHIVAPVGKFSGEVPYTCFVAKQSYLTKHPEKAEKFLKAVYRGYQYLKSESPDLAKALKPSFAGMSVEELEIAVNQYVEIDAWCANPAMEKTSFDKLVDIINRASGSSYNPSFTACVDNSYASKMMESLTA